MLGYKGNTEKGKRTTDEFGDLRSGIWNFLSSPLPSAVSRFSSYIIFIFCNFPLDIYLKKLNF
jgi:hypothetical protein